MSELDDNFTQLLGRQPTDKEIQALYRVRDALKLKATDAVWLLLMVLQHYETLYGTFPARIADAAREATQTARETALAQAKAVGEKTKAALAEAVREAAVASARQAAGAQLWKWVSVASHRHSAVNRLRGMVAVRSGRARRLRDGVGHRYKAGPDSGRRRFMGEHPRGTARLRPCEGGKPPRSRDLLWTGLDRQGRNLLCAIRTREGTRLAPPL